MFKFIIAIFIFILFSCKQSHQSQTKTDTKTLDFGLFTIETPKSWTKIKVMPFDSYVGKIAIDNKDTLGFDLGLYSDNLTEYQKIETPDGKTFYLSTYDTGKNITPIDSVNVNKVSKSNIIWDTIDGKRAKILTPKKSGIGMTGVYIDSLWNAGSNRDRFSLSGMNLKPKNEKEVLHAFQTIKFRKK